jgi:quinol monooxygenase YgiN
MKSIQHIFLSVLLLVGLAAAGAREEATPAPGPASVHVVAFVDVSEAAIPRALGVLRQFRDAVRGEPGNTGAELYQEIGRPYRFTINEQWRDRASFDGHSRGGAAAQFATGLKALQTAPAEIHVLQGLAVGPVKPPGPGRAKLLAVAQFDISAARLAEFAALAKTYAETSRNDGGSMRFDVLQDMPPRQNRIVVFETWSSPEDYEAHRTSAHAQKFRETAAAMLTGSYDDRFYGKFD